LRDAAPPLFVMNSYLVRGFVLALFGALTVLFGRALALDLDQVALLGVALGAVIGLVPDQRLTHRLIGFAIGFVLAWIGYAVRAAILPDVPMGRAVAVFGVLVVAVIVIAPTAGRVPLWATLVGAAAMVGAYEQTYADAPSLFTTDSPTAATTVLLAVAMGVLGSTLLGGSTEAADEQADQKAGAHA